MDDISSVVTWDPDADPARHASAKGHALYELYARLEARSKLVSIGSRAPADAQLVVAHMEELTGWKPELLPWRVWRFAGQVFPNKRALVIRGDIPLEIHPPAFVKSEVMPNPSSVVDDRAQRWVPLLPQRGMIVRNPARGDLLQSMAMKGGRPSIPAFATESLFVRRLREIGVELQLHTEPSTWPDFYSVDLTLCSRRRYDELDDERHSRKPPTKLINAWVAGTIPLVSPERGYLDLVRDGEDALVVHSPEDVMAAVSRLRSDPALVTRLRQGGQARALEFSQERVIERWERLLWEDLPAASLHDFAVAAGQVATAWGRLGWRTLRDTTLATGSRPE